MPPTPTHPVRGAPPRCTGFTLFEIAISLLILGATVVSVILAFPVAIKAQQMARFQAQASVVAVNLSHAFTDTNHIYWDQQCEAASLGASLSVRWTDLDIDQAIFDGLVNLVPLPTELAARIDSDGDEIAKVLAEGGCLYYPAPGSGPQNMVYGVIGYAQQNGLRNHPCIGWPYYDHFPGPPLTWEKANWELHGGSTEPWPGLSEFEELYAVFNADAQSQTAVVDAAGNVKQVDALQTPPDQALADAYLLKAEALLTAVCDAYGIGHHLSGTHVVPDLPQPLPATWSASDLNAFPPPALVWAASHLAHAACLQTAPQVQTPPNGPVPPDRVQYADDAMEACLAWAMRYASGSPDDWGAARPLARQCAWDFPLLQYDLFPTSAVPSFAPGAPDYAVAKSSASPFEPFPDGDVCWRVIGGARPTNVGQARGGYGFTNPLMRPNKPDIDASWGDERHFGLCARFAAAERMRELVCWTVDWQSYADAEEVPNCPRDACRGFIDSAGVQVMSEPYWTGNWSDANRTAVTVTVDYGLHGGHRPEIETAAYKQGYFGIWGADRNGNGVCDHGPVPASARLRAVTVARFDLYDKRLISGLRH